MNFLERLKQEKAELDEKIHRLELVDLDDGNGKISPIQRGLLFGQLQVMRAYTDILEKRLEDLQ